MTNITITQITPRLQNDEVQSIRVHFTYTIKIGDDSVSGSGAINIDSFAELVDFTGIADNIKKEMSENI